LDLHVAGRLPPEGFVKQEQIDLNEFLDNRFGRYYRGQIATRFSQAVDGQPVIGHLGGDSLGQSDTSAVRSA
jgi:hypothetical protein